MSKCNHKKICKFVLVEKEEEEEKKPRRESIVVRRSELFGGYTSGVRRFQNQHTGILNKAFFSITLRLIMYTNSVIKKMEQKAPHYYYHHHHLTKFIHQTS